MNLITSEVVNDGFSFEYSRRLIIAIRTKGCSWAKSKNGGCTHCTIPFSDIISENTHNIHSNFVSDINKLDSRNIHSLSLYTPGSFFDDEEVPSDIRHKILYSIANTSQIRHLSVESLPQFITEEKMRSMKELLPNIEIEIGLGLDSSNDDIRLNNINKNFSFNEYVHAVGLINGHGLKALTYILVKPIYLSENQAIEDAIKSISDSFDAGTSIISLEPMSVQKGTIAFDLYQRNEYTPPWFWSILEILRKTHGKGELRIGLFNYPTPMVGPKNCDLCSVRVRDAIRKYNVTQDIGNLNKQDCNCKKDWILGIS